MARIDALPEPPVSRPQSDKPQGHLALFLGLFAVSTSGPFFVMAHMDAYAAVFWRTLLAGALGLALAAARGALELQKLRLYARGLALAGVLMGAHFLLWIKAFDLTDYASNLLLLVSQPVTATVLARALGEPTPRHAWLAISLAVLGLLMIAGADLALGPRALLGDALCVVSGALIAFFYLAAREARARLPLDVFMGTTMLGASLVALPVSLLAHVPLVAYPAASWAWLFAIVVVTTFAGHGLMNLAARSVPLFELNLVIVLEPVVAIGLGALLFGARITLLQSVGGLLLASAVVVGLERRTRITQRASV